MLSHLIFIEKKPGFVCRTLHVSKLKLRDRGKFVYSLKMISGQNWQQSFDAAIPENIWGRTEGNNSSSLHLMSIELCQKLYYKHITGIESEFMKKVQWSPLFYRLGFRAVTATAWVWSLVEELRSYKPSNVAKERKKHTNKKTWGAYVLCHE